MDILLWSVISDYLTNTHTHWALLASTAWVVIPSRLPWQVSLLVTSGTSLPLFWFSLFPLNLFPSDVKSNSLSLCKFLFFPFYKSLNACVILLHSINWSFSFCRSSDVLISLVKSHSSRCSCVSSAPDLQYLHFVLTLMTCYLLYGMLSYI